MNRCLYCGTVGKLTREHVIPEALGACKRKKTVCASCNNETLSDLDKELTERSPLALLVGQELQKKGRYTWDVDHQAGNLLLEANPDHASRSMVVWPQVIFEDTGPTLRGDAEEIREFGWERFAHVLVESILSAFETVKTKQKRPRIVFERISGEIPPMYRYAPRLFATRRISEVDARASFQCRYKYSGDKRRLLRKLENWDTTARFRSHEQFLGSSRPTCKTSYELVAVFRSLVKMGINLLRLVCVRTEVDCSAFPEATGVVLGAVPLPMALLSANGFIWAADVAKLGCPDRAHMFRLLYDEERRFWNVYFCFFGGRAAASVRFPGPCHESWVTADVTAPIGSADWAIVHSPIFQRMNVHVDWKDLGRMIPSVPIENTHTEFSVVSG